MSNVSSSFLAVNKIKPTVYDVLLSKKLRYLLYSSALSVLTFYFSELGLTNISRNTLVVFYIFVVVGSVYTQVPNVRLKNIVPIVFLPLHLAIGTLLSLGYFPNLGLPIRLMFVIGVGLISYMILLTTNIFLVIGEREETIPLYRVALTWSQVLTVMVSIPYFAGIYKLPYISFVQASITGVSAFFFSIYLIWVLGFDRDVKRILAGERAYVSMLVAHIVFICGIATSFFPAESFLRSIFVSSILLACLGYVQAHYKNSVNKRLILEYGIVSFIFLIIVFIFPSH